MIVQRIAVGLGGINLVLLLGLVPRRSLVTAATAPSVLRVQSIELVDDHGRVRASLEVEASREVVFRLLDANGTIRVKLGASEEGSGLLLANDETEPGVHLLAKRTGTSLTLRGKGGLERVIAP